MQKNTTYESIGYVSHMPNVKLLLFNYSKNTINWNYPHRTAPFWRFYWNITPGAVIIHRNNRIELTPDIMILIPPNTDYASMSHQEFDQFYMHFFADPPFDRVKKQPIILPVESGQSFIPHLLDWLNSEPELLPYRLYSVIFDLLRFIPVNMFSDESLKTLDPRIEAALVIMDHEYKSKLSNMDIAARLNMSLNNFLRLFKRETGKSVHQHLLNLRLEKSQMLLAHTRDSIETIALMLCFTDRYHFSKAFKSHYKQTPVEYRRQFQC